MCDDNNVMMLNLVQLLYVASLLIYSFSLKVLDLSRKKNLGSSVEHKTDLRSDHKTGKKKEN